MSADKFWAQIMSWAEEESHRGRLVRAFRDNLGNNAELQAQRIGLLSVYMEREAQSRKGLALV
ncbi:MULTISPECIES: hypothetical protein [unclassified Streptomyces]|uniref:hypothetical protein n=1 Tax=unclassified Streptomyces TaxID=2593676 RepID=UPI0008888EB9|nr:MULTISPECIES: hypothetical protein [unclassified Streptomyces]PBC82974.1 hypothetical protein BX261_2893 [Streptomyces sp. 2321.6]SDR45931.1 hypothetical protein SAMN05216511_4309 [Streptomyces sp. KS_16]SEC79025.1 hypothetical protein SAMN05428940_2896 [Streptomyces sp. 2133.1]SNC69050.1 hypothetical protein SAMN06272741_2890 [Streptomyces sp. 2114.4]